MAFAPKHDQYNVKAASLEKKDKKTRKGVQLLNFRRNTTEGKDVYDPQKLIRGISGRCYEVLDLLGSGGFGAVHECRVVTSHLQQPPLTEQIEEAFVSYMGIDRDVLFSETSELSDLKTARFAVKVAKRCSLKVELDVLTKTRRQHHFCKLIDSGVEALTRLNFIVMTRLGPSLSDIQHKAPSRRFSISTATRAAIQMLDAIQEIHDCGFLHRDVKPSNYAIGMASERRQRLVHLLDFGISRYFRDHEREPRASTTWRGTLRYCPINNHMGFDLSRRDDLESWLYAVVEMMTGELPWHHLGRNMKRLVEREKRLARTTKRFFFLEDCPREFDVILTTIDRWGFFVQPDYDGIYVYLMRAMRAVGAQFTDPYDWELNTALQAAKRHEIIKANKQDRCRLKKSDFQLHQSAFGSQIFKRKGIAVNDARPTTAAFGPESVEADAPVRRLTVSRERPSDEVLSPRTPDVGEAEEPDHHQSSNNRSGWLGAAGEDLRRSSDWPLSSPQSSRTALSNGRPAAEMESEGEPPQYAELEPSRRGESLAETITAASAEHFLQPSSEGAGSGGANDRISGYAIAKESATLPKNRTGCRHQENCAMNGESKSTHTARKKTVSKPRDRRKYEF